MTTLITGATGFLGSAVVRLLLAEGQQLRALVRAGSDTKNIDGLDIERVTGDLTDMASLKAAAKGCDALYHVAADYRLWIPKPKEIYDINVEGTRNLMRAAGEAGVGRIVYTSSVAVLGLHKDGTPADEDVPVSLEDMTGHYKRSKYLAEEVVRGMVVKDGLPAVIVNPSTPIGARDIKPTPTGRIIVDFVNGRMPAYVDTGLNLVHVDDCARGHLLAYERGKIGERYILGGEDLTLREILLALGRITGRPAPGVRLPNRLLVPFAYGVEGWARLSGMEPRLTVDSLRMARKYMFFSSEKAKRELGFSSRSAEAALSDAVAWFSANNYFKSAVSAASQSR
ncbi:MAG: NAD-dependent epimerase/dehydratase family protein [Rhodospirillaceae bacterium]|jgi:dihydroflavonol-4-reductase|nr:NAD-dependent epimerase/dehydratase family protein [Rhodospirillaceae bacterium]MBT3628650.1 NAD-dependent epimerase/dehydratase family protein [Rhodospirillaceae bacterium]MBT3927616.1 NAD-dependent epimerase/dehydratase family protein [Rhodospirillaceae bacterium]MBT5677491.1 NAD-dependent epimerase/dehydratase family protein [Rhodospirillaceae bacterium]MBT5780060.1 NAD-dependent epimerase/dehydratase family protein [Rhodospirillaceae bacterium]